MVGVARAPVIGVMTMIPVWRAAAGAAIGLVVAGCDPVAAVYVRQPLRVAPADECVARALASSPLVAKVRATAHPHTRGFDVDVRDSSEALRSTGRVATVELTTAADSAVVTVMFRLYGKMTWNVDAEESRELGTLASALARTVRGACAPDAPAAERCRVSGMWWTKNCGSSAADATR